MVASGATFAAVAGFPRLAAVSPEFDDLCELVHICRRNARAKLPNQPLRSVGTMSDPDNAPDCDFCKSGHVITSTQEIAFRQWTDKGYVFCRTTIPIGVCDRCGSRHWNEDAEAIIQDVVRQEYRKLF